LGACRAYDLQINAHNHGSLLFGCEFLAVNCGGSDQVRGSQGRSWSSRNTFALTCPQTALKNGVLSGK
jgi:hypothetical protein